VSDQLSLFAQGPIEVSKRGILLTEPDLWLDAGSPGDTAFVSHAHSDHICAHRRVLLTRPTARFFNLRLKDHGSELVELDYGDPYPLGSSQVTLFPAGHVLGSAQVLVENSRRTVYTGDFKLRPGLTCEPAQVRRCDTLIMEATFGLPEYSFPGPRELEDILRTEINQALSNGRQPIIRAYALGKAQETVAILNRLNYRVVVDAETRRYCDLYESLGVKLGPVSTLAAREHRSKSLLENTVVVVGGSVAFHRLRGEIQPHHAMFVSGWGVRPDARYRFKVDRVVPLSDHADFNDLMEYVTQCQPREVLVTHGAPEFAVHLKRKGFSARYIG
jgi:Cft2 family RNA processing exonuclease